MPIRLTVFILLFLWGCKNQTSSDVESSGGVDCNGDEVCDGLDNDCDEVVDETDASLGQVCDLEEQGCLGEGQFVCLDGSLICQVDMDDSIEELCNGADDDCDGTVDEGFAFEGEIVEIDQVCQVGVGACENEGVLQCADENSVECSVDPLEANAELCNGADDDCDGTVDEGFAPVDPNLNTGDPCEVGIGACRSEGIVACGEDGTPPDCNAVQGEPTSEVCDDVDNDCDASIDEGNPGGGAVCQFQNNPECGDGILTCEAGSLLCKNDSPFAAEQFCDDVDEDCDGITDEGNPEGEQDCEVEGEQGVCLAGRTVCSRNADGTSDLICVSRVPAGIEFCDEIDNDCDGQVDEGNLGGGQECFVEGSVGVCAVGVRQCVEGGYRCVAESPDPTDEICDGEDDDCDGTSDENSMFVGDECETNSPGVCAEGVLRCLFGELDCRTTRNAVAESCDGLDNDCDGTVDEDSPGIGADCNTGEDGVCSAGTIECVNGDIECVRDQSPSDEICDGRDNNCDGAVDNEPSGVDEECDTGEPGVCAPGIRACRAGRLVCNQNVEEQGDDCDGLDNDCDGDVDENLDAVPCYEGPEGTEGVGRCQGGLKSCEDGVFGSCEGDVVPRGQELCNQIDDDCDGRMDENIDFEEAFDHCDGNDNDCDGRIDENDFFAGQACETGLPSVCSQGTYGCGEVVGNGGIRSTERVCFPNIAVGENDEICNQIDDDCDGLSDQEDPDVIGSGEECDTGSQGICASGTTVCTGEGIRCVGPQALPELCDGVDNDCDGTTDEDFSNENPQNPGNPPARDGGQCDTEFQEFFYAGACRQGLWRCEESDLICKPIAFDGGNVPMEQDDGVDNDCDGQVDEGF